MRFLLGILFLILIAAIAGMATGYVKIGGNLGSVNCNTTAPTLNASMPTVNVDEKTIRVPTVTIDKPGENSAAPK